MKKSINIGIIGLGYWGPNLLRNFQSLNQCRVTFLCDKNKEILKKLKHRNPTVAITKDYKELIRSENVDAVVISTPIKTHYEIALECIKNKKHIFVEKPLTDSVKKAQEIEKQLRKEDKDVLGTIVSVKKTGNYKIDITLDNGQVWRSVESVYNRLPVKKSQKVIISKAAISGHILRVTGKKVAIRVRKIS